MKRHNIIKVISYLFIICLIFYTGYVFRYAKDMIVDATSPDKIVVIHGKCGG